MLQVDAGAEWADSEKARSDRPDARAAAIVGRMPGLLCFL
jgi:hypothetical protein